LPVRVLFARVSVNIDSAPVVPSVLGEGTVVHCQASNAATRPHQSTTDPEARLAKKGAGKEAKLSYTESVLMENRNGIADVQGSSHASRLGANGASRPSHGPFGIDDPNRQSIDGRRAQPHLETESTARGVTRQSRPEDKSNLGEH